MMFRDKPVVLYTFDNNYSMQAGVSITSLFESNRETAFSLYIISDQVSRENREKLLRIAKNYNNHITFIEMPDMEELCGIKLESNWWSKMAYCRLFLTKLLPEEIEKILYIDPDTLVVGNIDHLLATMDSVEFNDYYAAACIDISPVVKKYHGFKKTDLYYNSGVLPINLKRWREDNVYSLFVSEIERRKGKSLDVDQSYINCVMINNIMTLPAEFNIMPTYYDDYEVYARGFEDGEIYKKQEIDYAVNHPVIIHFCGHGRYIRPWFVNSNHPKVAQWKACFELTEWKDTQLGEFHPKTGKLSSIKYILLWNALQIPFLAPICMRMVHGFWPKLYRHSAG